MNKNETIVDSFAPGTTTTGPSGQKAHPADHRAQQTPRQKTVPSGRQRMVAGGQWSVEPVFH